MFIEVQFSLYPLGENEISKYIEKIVEIVKSFSLPVEVGAMSSITYGESKIVFEAVNKAIESLEGTHYILVMTVSNACPLTQRKENK